MVNVRVIQKNKGVLLPELVSVMVCMLLKIAGTQSCRTTFFLSDIFGYPLGCWNFRRKVTPAVWPFVVALFEIHDNGKRCFRWLKLMEMIAVIVNSVEHVGNFCFCMITFAGKTIFWQQEYGDSVWSVKDVLIHGTVFPCCFPSRFLPHALIKTWNYVNFNLSSVWPN